MSDYLVRGIDKEGKFKFVAASTTGLVNEACKSHETSATASAALGRTLTAGALMSTMLKNPTDSLTLIINGGGPLGNILVVVNQAGELKGYVSNPTADLALNANGKLDVSGVVGNVGYVKTIVDLGMKEPYIGQSQLLKISLEKNNPTFRNQQFDILKVEKENILPAILEFERAMKVKNFSRAKDVVQVIENIATDYPDLLILTGLWEHHSAIGYSTALPISCS